MSNMGAQNSHRSMGEEYKLTCRCDGESTIWSGSELGNENKVSVGRGTLSEMNTGRSWNIFTLPISLRNGFEHYAILN